MAPRVHYSSSPTTAAAAAPSSPPATCTGERRKVFTVWMKSLVLNGHGCTVYDSDGGIVYRVDNYGSARCGGVCLMELHGTVVLNIVKRRLTFGRWEGYRRWPGQTPWFTVTRPCSPFRWRRPPASSCEFWCDDTGRVSRYTITDERRTGKQGCRIVDSSTGLACGVALGEDVLSLVAEPHADPSLVMGLVLVHGLMNHTMWTEATRLGKPRRIMPVMYSVLLPELLADTGHDSDVLLPELYGTARHGSVRRSESETRGRDPNRAG